MPRRAESTGRGAGPDRTPGRATARRAGQVLGIATSAALGTAAVAALRSTRRRPPLASPGSATGPAAVPRCPGGDHTADLVDRERTADRLLAASARHSYDPDTDVDWAAPLDPDKFYLPPTAMALYETHLWDRLSHRERVELSKHESASIAYMGIWFEVILIQLLARHMYFQDLQSRHVRYALTEIADECRHSMMFQRMIEKLDVPGYPPGPLTRFRGWVMKTFESGPAIFTAALVVEELLDTIQRATFPDESIQPLMRDVTRIHVVEEARHVKYAREELKRQWVRAPRAQRDVVRLVAGQAIWVVYRNLVNPRVYAAVGLDPREAKRVELSSPHRRATAAWATRRLRAFFTDVGLMRGPALAMWRSVGALDEIPESSPLASRPA